MNNDFRKTDIFIDGTSCDSDSSKMFRNLDMILRRNGQLIVAPVTGNYLLTGQMKTSMDFRTRGCLFGNANCR